MSVRVRFAPSPTGFLHVGGARTALFNWLYARRTGGTFVLRIEDTDAARNTQEAVQVIYDGLRWLGIEWDEGPLVGGDRGPYFQSERNAIYERYFQRLQDAGYLYTEENGATRFRSPRETVVVEDAVCGSVPFDLSDPATHPDMTIRRPDGSWIFHFVNVVDDIEMGITHVMRGEDHLSNTPKHMELYRALGATPPVWAHIPLILNMDGTKMSKRDAGASIFHYVADGFAPEGVRNFLCLLGWSPKGNREKIPIEEVITLFDLDKINRRNAAFDLEKCAWLSGEWFREMPPERHRTLAWEALNRAGVDLAKFPAEYVQRALDTCQGKLRVLKDLPAYAGFYFRDDYPIDEAAAAKHLTAETKPRLEAVRTALAGLPDLDVTSIEAALKTLATQFGVKLGAFLQPVRVALTGSTAGPSMYHLVEILGREKVLERLDRAA